MPTVYSEGGLSRYLAAIRNFPLLNAAEEAKYAERWREHGDREAAYRLVTSHLRLAAKIALRYRGYGLPVADLISEANVGLMLAVKRFEPKKGFRLATYAMWWIKATVQEYVLRSWSLVKIGTTAAQKKLFFNLRKLKNRIGASDEGELSPEQVAYVAKELKVDGRDVVEMNGRIRGDVSLNVPMAQADTSEEMQDRLVDPSPDPETLVSDAQDRERMGSALKDALAALTSRERSIIEARFLTEQPQTFDELAAEFGVSRERIRQIETRALQKIKGAVCARLDAIPLGPTRLRMPNLGAVEPSLRAGSQA
ncbi:RNA polymerase sigma factor RpoH [Bradyrhizobium sp. BWC-3-1]|uniref:RNA polymerase sigma factor RpoH n=1 Tax=Bradyrhizobium sp. BWC-3-1 TaxID=3080012 RepID=UPI00397D8E8E